MNLSENFKKFMGIEALEAQIKSPIGTKLKAYAEDAEGLEPTGGWQGRQDAARHLLAVGDISRKVGPTAASLLANINEYILGAGASVEDTEMDVHNNELALTLFNAKSYEEVKERVKKLMESPSYKDTSDKTKPVVNKLD